MAQLFDHVALHLNPNDNVAIAKTDIAPGTPITMFDERILAIRDGIPVAHKFALRAIAPGAPVTRYGYPIGVATQAIQPGEWVHTHNVAVGEIFKEYTFNVMNVSPRAPSRQTFLGYARADGRAGTRNYLAVIATVNCAAHATLDIARAFSPERLAAFPNVDGVIPIVHHSGCGHVAGSVADRYLKNALANVARNPNIAGYIVVGLGCEVNLMEDWSGITPAHTFDAFPPNGFGINIQDRGYRQTVELGIRAIEKMLPRANQIARTPQPISELTMALQCGGSDGWSGITANPLVGLVVDRLVALGGTAVLSETPEIFGAEHLLLQRVASEEVGRKLIARFQWWNDQAQKFGFTVDNNPGPGNKRGGLTTIFEKSLGAAAKGGSSPLMEVYEYAESVTGKGLTFMDTPGYDPVSATGQLAGGCNLIVFTTGRGSVFGSNLAPCIKIATNNALYARMRADLDFNAGQILDGLPMRDAADQLLAQVIAVASGEKTQSEQNGLPDCEFVPWTPGAVV